MIYFQFILRGLQRHFAFDSDQCAIPSERQFSLSNTRRVAVPTPPASQSRSSWAARVLARYHQFKETVRWRQGAKGDLNELLPFDAEILAMLGLLL